MNTAHPLPRLASIDRSQLLLHSVDVENLIEPEHSARSIWELIGRLDLSRYYSEIAAVEGHEKNRELRYQSAAEMRSDLKRLRRDTESGRSPGLITGATAATTGSGVGQGEVAAPKTAPSWGRRWIPGGAAVLLFD